MKRSHVLPAALLALVVLGALPIAFLRSHNSGLRARLNEKRVQQDARGAAAGALLSHAQAGTGQARPAGETRNDAAPRLARLHTEVASLETRAAEHYATHLKANDASSRDRDPEKAMTKLEHLQNVGQDTPARAIQTLFWAALNGENEAMARTILWDEATRPSVQALIERLPAAARTQYPTPESLAALYISKFALDVSAIHIAETVQQDPTRAMLTVKGVTGRDEHLPMQRGPNGWQLVAGEAHLRALNDELAGRK